MSWPAILRDSSALSLAGMIGTLFFGVLSIILYIRSRKFKRLDAVWVASTLQSKRHPDVRILFRNAEIEDLSRIRVLFINSGTEAIRRSDFAQSTGAAVNFTPDRAGTTFFSAACLAGEIAECGAECGIQAESANFRFEFLNPGQRVVAEFLYSGQTPTIHATLIGGKLRARRYSRLNHSLAFASMLTTYGFVFLAVGAWLALVKLMQYLHVPFSRSLALLLFALVLIPAIFIGVARSDKFLSRVYANKQQRALEHYLTQ